MSKEYTVKFIFGQEPLNGTITVTKTFILEKFKEFEDLATSIVRSLQDDLKTFKEITYYIECPEYVIPDTAVENFNDKWVSFSTALGSLDWSSVTLDEYMEGQQRGGKSKVPRKMSKTKEKVKVGNAMRVVYQGPRGGKYVKVKGQFVSVKKL